MGVCDAGRVHFSILDLTSTPYPCLFCYILHSNYYTTTSSSPKRAPHLQPTTNPRHHPLPESLTQFTLITRTSHVGDWSHHLLYFPRGAAGETGKGGVGG